MNVIAVCFFLCVFCWAVVSLNRKSNLKTESSTSIANSEIPLVDEGMPLPVLNPRWKKIDDFTKYMELEHGWLVTKWEDSGLGMTFVPKPASTPAQGQSQK